MTEELRAQFDDDRAPLRAGSRELVVLSPREAPAWRVSGDVLLLAIGAALTVLWLALATYYITTEIDWGGLLYFLPHELGAIVAGIFVPLAFLWLLPAFLARGRDQRAETRMLAAYLQDLIYPAEGAGARVREVTAALRAQAQELNDASDRAAGEMGAATRLLKGGSEELIKVAQRTAAALKTAGGSIGQRTAAVASTSDRLAGQMDKIDGRLGARLEHLDGVGRVLGERAGALKEQTAGQARTLDEASSRAEGVVSVIGGVLEKSAATIATVAAEAAKLEQGMAELVGGRAEELVKAADHTATVLKTTSAAIGRRAEALTAASGGLADQVDKIDGRLEVRLDHLEGLARTFVERAEALEEQTVRQAHAFDEAGGRAKANLAAIEGTLHAERHGSRQCRRGGGQSRSRHVRARGRPRRRAHQGGTAGRGYDRGRRRRYRPARQHVKNLLPDAASRATVEAIVSRRVRRIPLR